ncbi:hypothetical protein AX17_001096 [Amanita inopinata Kibby_2008]|nr:hypothetical protein AX17_001096 [Amanita inopinata Kibby_2008]
MLEAPEHPLPHIPYYSIEYPGYVHLSSVQHVVNNLGGQSKLDSVFRRATSKAESILELSFRPNNCFAHQIPGEVTCSNNIVFKITKRKRKTKDGGSVGEYTANATGVISKTVRFRSMIDYQYQPYIQDPVSQLRIAMDELNVEIMRTYAIPGEKADYAVPNDLEPMANLDPMLLSDTLLSQKRLLSDTNTTRSNLRLFPPPLFSRQAIPQGYNFRSNTASMVSSTVNEQTGEEKKRLINRMRWRGFGPATIMFSDIHVPESPPQAVDQGKDQIDQQLLKKLHVLFKQRPIWTRMSLLNQFSGVETREIMNSKLLLPLVCYVFQDGPWRDTLVRFGYDPRTDPLARFYQRLYFRNANHPIARPSVTTRRQERTTVLSRIHGNEINADHDIGKSRSHIFDGKNLTKETAAFQLCDIEDPMLKDMIEEPHDIREECDERDGWFTTHAYERIKLVLRHKFFSLLEGHVATDDECRGLLAASEGTVKLPPSRSQKLRAGKHNMAKGALRPEDAAAVRLRAALDRNAKSQYKKRTS